MTRDELIETMARAMEPDAWWNADGPLADVADVLRRPSINAATAALTAIEAAGMLVVPVEPTETQITDGLLTLTMPWSDALQPHVDQDRAIMGHVYVVMVRGLAPEDSTSE